MKAIIESLRSFGLDVTESTIKQSNKFQHVKVLDGSCGKSGWYVYDGHKVTFARFDRSDSPKTVTSIQLKNKLNGLSDYERQYYERTKAKEMIELIKQAELEREVKYQELLVKWQNMSLINKDYPKNEYFSKVKFYPDFRIAGNAVIIPMYANLNQEINGYQVIVTKDNHTTKLFGNGTKFNGSFYPMMNQHSIEDIDIVVIAEGYRTSYAINAICTTADLDGDVVATLCAFSCNNMINVARYIKNNYPKVKIYICCDNDTAGIISGKRCVEEGVADKFFIASDIDKEDAYDWLINKGIGYTVERLESDFWYLKNYPIKTIIKVEV